MSEAKSGAILRDASLRDAPQDEGLVRRLSFAIRFRCRAYAPEALILRSRHRSRFTEIGQFKLRKSATADLRGGVSKDGDEQECCGFVHMRVGARHSDRLRIRRPPLVLEVSAEDMRRPDVVQAHLAVASLTIAWHYVLSIPNHDKAAGLIEEALQSVVDLREATKGNKR